MVDRVRSDVQKQFACKAVDTVFVRVGLIFSLPFLFVIPSFPPTYYLILASFSHFFSGLPNPDKGLGSAVSYPSTSTISDLKTHLVALAAKNRKKTKTKLYVAFMF